MVPEPLRLDLPREELAFTPGVIPALYQIVEDLVKPGHGKVLTMTPAYGFFLHACEYAPGFSHPAGRQRGTAAKDARKMEHTVGAAGGASGVLSLLRQDPPQGAGDDGVLSRFLQKCKASDIFSSSFRSVSLLYWSHTKKHTAEVLPFSAGKS